MAENEQHIAVIGAGPAGLTAAFALHRAGRTGIILEADDVVGGIARTVERDGYRFDIGGHRFFTKVKAIDDLWDDMLGEPMLLRPRMSRIYYGGKFYDYPLRASNALKNMGIFRAAACMLSYGKARLRPNRDPKNYEQWVVNQFGSKLFDMFFRSYTEKVWGIPCDQIGADWAAQRIKGLSLGEAVRNAIFGGVRKSRATRGKRAVVKTLIDEFKYPRLGPGQLWENAASAVQRGGWDLRMNTSVVELTREPAREATREQAGEPTRAETAEASTRITSINVEDKEGHRQTLSVSHVFSSMPVQTLLRSMSPPPPQVVLQAANELKYRDFLTIVLVIANPDMFPDNWIYVHAPEVRMGRIQNFKNWSPQMLPDQSETCLGLEYFVNEGDDLWTSADEALVTLGYNELKTIGLANGALVRGYVVRMPKAYPVYDAGYQERLGIIRKWISTIDNLDCLGRNGQHRYNNQDHSMATALIAVDNLVTGADRDPWAVNEDAEYHEIARTERAAPITPMTSGQLRPTSQPSPDSNEHDVPAVVMLGDPTAAMSERMLDDGQMDQNVVVEDEPPMGG